MLLLFELVVSTNFKGQEGLVFSILVWVWYWELEAHGLGTAIFICSVHLFIRGRDQHLRNTPIVIQNMKRVQTKGMFP